VNNINFQSPVVRTTPMQVESSMRLENR